MKFISKPIQILTILLCPFWFAAAHADEIKVGAHLSLSGATARAGSGFLEGMKVAEEMFNAASKKHKIKLVVIDDESVPAKAVSAVEKLAAEGVVGIVGGYGSNVIGPASDMAEKFGLTYLTAGGVSDELTKRGHKHFFRLNNNPGYERGVMTLFEELKVKSVSIVYSTKEAPAKLAIGVEKAAQAKGIKVAMHPFDPAITDFKPVINKIRVIDKPEVILMSGYENDYVGIIRAAKVLKPQVKAMIGMWSLATTKMSSEFPDLMTNVIGSTMFAQPMVFTKPQDKRFAETYQRMYAKEVDYQAQFGFTKAELLFEAVTRAADKGALKKGGLSEELRKTDRDTFIGRVTFDEYGDNPNFRLRMGQHQGGKVVVVSPRADSTGAIVYPGVPW